MAWLFKSRKPAPSPSRGPVVPFEEFDSDERLLDMHSLLRQASTRVSVDQLVQTGKRHIQVLSHDKLQDLINRSVQTIVEKHLSRFSNVSEETAERIAEESRAEFQELLSQYKEMSRAKADVERSRKDLDEELETLRKELEAVRRSAPVAPVAPASGPVAEPELPEGSLRKENVILGRRIEKLNEYVASLEGALKTLSNSKLQSNQQIQNVLRQLGLAQEDKYLDKKKEALKLVLETNQSVRRVAKGLAEKGISLATPGSSALAAAAQASLPAPEPAPVPAPTVASSPVPVPEPAPAARPAAPAQEPIPLAAATRVEWSFEG